MIEPVLRPNGKLYRPRKVIAFGVYDDHEDIVGVVVFGTRERDRALALARRFVAEHLDSRCEPADPRPVWWRGGYEWGRHAWIPDETRGRAGVWFRKIVERSDDGDENHPV